MKLKIQVSLAVVAVFIFSIKLCSSQDVINRDDFIKDHTVDITNIIHAFDEILIQAPSPIQPPVNTTLVVCIVSKDELTEIWNEIERDESAEIGSPMNFTYSTNCNELEKIKTGILKMKHNFKALLKQQISSVKYEELKATYDKDMGLLSKRLNNEKALAEGEQIKIVGELQDQLQKQQDEIHNILKKLEDEQNALNEAYVGSCVANIDRNEIDRAVEVFKNITNYREIKRIVSATYSTKPESFESAVLFIRQVSDPEPVLIGYTCLFEELTKINQLKDMRILILTNELRTKTDLPFEQLKAKVMGITEEIIQKNDFQAFIDYANTKGATRDVDFVKQVTPMIVKMVYNKPTDMLFGDDPRNVQLLLNLLPKFSNLHHQLYVINDLITVMKEVGHTTKKAIFLVIYKAMQARTASDKVDDKYAKSLIADVENNLPEGVRVFMSSNVCIQNSESGEFLFLSTSYIVPFGMQMKMLATANLTNANNLDLFSHIFNFTDNGNKVQIRNVKSNELVAVGDIVHDFPYIAPVNPDVDFTLDIVSEGKFTIKSKKQGYLIPMDESKIQSGMFISREVTGMHFIDYSEEETTSSETNATWLIKQCE